MDPAMNVPLIAGDKQWTLHFGNKARQLAERELKRPITTIGEQVGATEMTVLLWAALQKHHPGLTIDDVDDIIDAAGLDVVAEALGKAAEASLPKAVADSGESEQNPPKAGTGTSS